MNIEQLLPLLLLSSLASAFILSVTQLTDFLPIYLSATSSLLKFITFGNMNFENFPETFEEMLQVLELKGYQRTKYFIQCPFCLGTWTSLLCSVYCVWCFDATWKLLPAIWLSSAFLAVRLRLLLDDNVQ